MTTPPPTLSPHPSASRSHPPAPSPRRRRRRRRRRRWRCPVALAAPKVRRRSRRRNSTGRVSTTSRSSRWDTTSSSLPDGVRPASSATITVLVPAAALPCAPPECQWASDARAGRGTRRPTAATRGRRQPLLPTRRRVPTATRRARWALPTQRRVARGDGDGVGASGFGAALAAPPLRGGGARDGRRIVRKRAVRRRARAQALTEDGVYIPIFDTEGRDDVDDADCATPLLCRSPSRVAAWSGWRVGGYAPVDERLPPAVVSPPPPAPWLRLMLRSSRARAVCAVARRAAPRLRRRARRRRPPRRRTADANARRPRRRLPSPPPLPSSLRAAARRRGGGGAAAFRVTFDVRLGGALALLRRAPRRRFGAAGIDADVHAFRAGTDEGEYGTLTRETAAPARRPEEPPARPLAVPEPGSWRRGRGAELFGVPENPWDADGGGGGGRGRGRRRRWRRCTTARRCARGRRRRWCAAARALRVRIRL